MSLQQRRIFKWNLHKTVPKEESSFGPFSRDLATYLVRQIEDFHVLLMLKAVSKASANCVRHAIHAHSSDDDPFDYWFCHFYPAFNTSMLSFPMQVMYHDKLFIDWGGNDAFLNGGQRLIVHELAFEFKDQNAVMKTSHDAVQWLTERKVTKKPNCLFTRFVVEWPGVGVFHEPTSLIRELGCEDRMKHIGGLELVMRLTPYTMVGNKPFGFDTESCFDWDSNSSLLYHILLGRVLYS
jgi:hypothetical protein